MQDVSLGNGIKVELGPNWIHGLGESAHQNPIYTMALKHGLANVLSDPDSLSTFDDNGPVDMDEELDAFDEAWTLFLAVAGNLTLALLLSAKIFILRPRGTSNQTASGSYSQSRV